MKYMGSKNRISKELIPFITKDLQQNQWYVEPFVGGCNLIDKIDHNLKIGADNNKYLIAMWKELQNGWVPPKELSEAEYLDIKLDYKTNGIKYPDYIKGYVGFNCAYRSCFFTGYARTDKYANYVLNGFNNVTKQIPKILNIEFSYSNYIDLSIPENSIIYCDPPYANTSKYDKNGFNSARFWQWCREKTKEGNKVFVSEYAAPEDFVCLWEKEISSNLASNGNKATEKLFVHQSQI